MYVLNEYLSYLMYILYLKNEYVYLSYLIYPPQVEGLASKFSMKNTILNIGNGLALLGITTVICEFVLMHFIQV